MSAGSPERLVYMANQIAAFFITQPGEDSAVRTADHLKAYWTPAMRHAIVDWQAGGGEGLSPVAGQAVRLLGQSHEALRDMVLAHGHRPTGHVDGDDAG